MIVYTVEEDNDSKMGPCFELIGVYCTLERAREAVAERKKLVPFTYYQILTWKDEGCVATEIVK